MLPSFEYCATRMSKMYPFNQMIANIDENKLRKLDLTSFFVVKKYRKFKNKANKQKDQNNT